MDNLAGTIPHYYTDTKTQKAMNEVARQYTRIKTVTEVHVQALNEEVHFVKGRKLAEDAMLWASKVAAPFMQLSYIHVTVSQFALRLGLNCYMD